MTEQMETRDILLDWLHKTMTYRMELVFDILKRFTFHEGGRGEEYCQDYRSKDKLVQCNLRKPVHREIRA